MKAYYLVFFLTLVLSWWLPAENEKQHKWKLFWMFLPLFVFAAIRVDFGNDYPVYEEFFDEVHRYFDFKLDSDVRLEMGFQWLNHLLPSYRALLVLNAFMLSLALGVFLYHNVPQKYLWLAVVLIFLNPEKNIYGSLVGIRNGLVVTSFLLGFVLIQKRKLVLFSLLIFLLYTIHRSVILFLPLAYFVGQNRPFSKKEIWIWGISVIVLLTMSMSGLTEIISSIISNDYLDRYETYLEESNKHRGILMVASSLVLLFLMVLSFYRNRNQLSEQDNSLFRIGLLYICTAFLGSLATRASYFYDMFFVATVVKVFSLKNNDTYVRVSLVGLAIIMSLYSMFVVWMGSPYWNHSVYHSLLGDW